MEGAPGPVTTGAGSVPKHGGPSGRLGRFGRSVRSGSGRSGSVRSGRSRRFGRSAPSPDIAALLADAVRGPEPDGESERRAVDAFRVARDSGAHHASTRRCDDWRPRRRLWPSTLSSVRAAVGLLVGGLVLGGAAYAGIGPLGVHHGSRHDTSDGTGPSRTAENGTDLPPGTGTAGGYPSVPGTPGLAPVPGRPDTAKDTEAHCRAYERVRDKGQALEATAWRRLVEAAGGVDEVPAYCAAVEAQNDSGQNSGSQDGGTPSSAATDEASPPADVDVDVTDPTGDTGAGADATEGTDSTDRTDGTGSVDGVVGGRTSGGKAGAKAAR